MTPALEVRNLTKSFGTVRAVDDVSFSVPSGATVALLGGNGAGKTTTISMLLGLLLPTSGAVRALGHDLVRDRYAVLHRMNFSSPYVELPHRLTVGQNLIVYAELYGVSDAKGRVAELADRLHIADLLDRPAGKLSAGQKTRVALAKALVNHPDLLLLDEPTASLDPDTGDWVRRYLEEYRADTGATMLLASHNMAEVERLCDSVLMLRAGKIVDQGSPAELLAKYGRRTMEDVFLDIARDRRAEPEAEPASDEVPA
ncbi:ABC transporter ATP-binding protein [Thalassobaculum litoreum]|uniref:ABC-2 type transport system ATP-binding protein n=1 Tax=Thalassobaculum litoreum DSM 18839 TaxID=1123362 RepID=A0A8G2BKV9_9PROT|nr:ABC transporter ATP-binding protein [Thalassobaculum litoreum]SDG30491.1 ABC-2 type transport system ATP-binding protein [Thalassobaculum litoreum DSM 18839]